MSNLIQIKRSDTTSIPASLANGELAHTSNGEVLYIGSNNAVVAIGGKRFPGVLTANQALVVNSTSSIDSIKVANLVPIKILANGSHGTVGQVLVSDGANVFWGTGTAGSNTTIQFNDSNVANGVVAFTINKATNTMFVSNAINVGGNVSILTDSFIVGNSTVNTVITSSSITTTGNSNTGNTNITGFINVSSTANVGGATTLRDTLTVNGAVTIANTLATGNVTVTGFANVSTTLNVTGATTVNGALTVNNTAAVGNTTITGFANVSTTLNVTGATTVNGALTVNNTAAVGNTTVTGFVNVSTTLNVTGAATVNGATTINNTLATGNTTVTGFANVSTTLNVTGAATVNGALTVNNTAAVGNTTVTGFANVSSTANVGGATTLRSTLTVNGAVTIANTLATGNTTVTGFANVIGNLQANTLTVGDTSITGNLTVTGILTTVSTNNLIVQDSLIQLASNNTVGTDVIDIGFFGVLDTGSGNTFTGLFRDASDSGVYKLFQGLTPAPTTTINTGNASFSFAELQSFIKTGGTGLTGLIANSSTIAITANSTLNVAIAANTLTLSTPLAGTSGGTGLNTYTIEDILVANSSNGFRKLSLGTSGKVLMSNGTALIYDTLNGGTF